MQDTQNHILEILSMKDLKTSLIQIDIGKIMNYLASPYFDAHTMMGTLPIQHYVSQV